MTRLQVVLAATGLEPIRDVLQDWSAVGLVAPFVWQASGEASGALLVADGRGRRMPVQAVAADSQSDQAVFTVLGAALDGVAEVPSDEVARVEELVVGSLAAGVAVSRVRATVVLAGSGGTTSRLASPGWYNLVLAPEESDRPGAGRLILDTAAAPSEVAVHAAGSLAGALGLWVGVESTAFGDESAASSGSAHLSRSYLRRLDAGPAERAIRDLVLRTSPHLPLPVVPGGVEYIEDVQLATQNMALAFWTRNAAVLNSGRERPSEDNRAKSVGALEAIQMFFGFLWAAIRNAPRNWAVGIVRRAKGAVASTVQGWTFGATADSAYKVVVGGVNPDGTPASWDDFGDAVEHLAASLGGPGSYQGHVPHEDLGTLWKQFAAASFTLCDAGIRVQEFPPVQIGTRTGVLRDREDAVPGPATAFAGLGPQLTGYGIEAAPVSATDVIAVARLEHQLAALAGQPGQGVSASTALAELRTWRARWSSSFAVKVAEHLGHALGMVRHEISGIVERMKQSASDEIGDEIERTQRGIARFLQVISISWAVLTIVAVVLWVTSTAGARNAILIWVGILVGLLLVWAVTSIAVFISGQKALFQLINHRRELASYEEVDQKNLRYALRDARRLADAYPQLQRWSEMLGSILAQPFGAPRTGLDEGLPALAGLPPSIEIGQASPDPAELDIVAAELRRRIFEQGWLSATWDSFVANAHYRLGGRGIELRDNPNLLFRQLGEGDQTLLPELRDHLRKHGVEPAVGDAAWGRALALLTGEYRHFGDQLLHHVETPDGIAGGVSYQEFMRGMDPVASDAGQTFDASALTEAARVSGVTAVARTYSIAISDGLSRTVVVRQLSTGMPEYSFVARAQSADEGTPMFSSIGDDGPDIL